MQDTNFRIGDELAKAYEDGYQEGFEKGRLVKFNSQEDFTEKINELILEGISMNIEVVIYLGGRE